MIYYVAHEYGGDVNNFNRAKKITHDLQVNDTDNVYVCPLLLFSHMGYNELGYDVEIELCLDVLSACDKLIIASDISRGVHAELDFANKVGMEVEFIEQV